MLRVMIIAVIGFVVGCQRPVFLDLGARFPMLENGRVSSDKIFELSKVTSPQLVINFFAPDCPPCITELPELKKFYDTSLLAGKVTFAAVGSSLDAVAQGEVVNHEQAAQIVASFAREHRITYPIYLADTATLKSWQVTGFPETFLFTRNRQGNWQLKRKFISAVTAEQLQAVLQESEPSLY